MQKVIWQRTKSQPAQRRTNQPRKKFKFVWPRGGFVKGLIFLLILTLIGLAVAWAVKNNQIWKFKQTEYVGLVNLTSKDIDPHIETFKQYHIWRINNNQIEKEISKQFIQIEGVRVEKSYPDKLRIYVLETVPAVVYKNFNGSYLIDKEGKIIEAFNNNEENSFDERDYNLALGFGSPNADYIEDRVVANFDEENIDEELKEFKFEEYEFGLKVEILNALVGEVKTKFDDILNKSNVAEEWSVKYRVPLVTAWDEKVYKKGEKIDKERILFWDKSINRISDILDITPAGILWDGKFRLFIKTDADSTIILSPIRKLDDQLEDLGLLIRTQKLKPLDHKKIDLSSEKVLVE